MTQAKTEPTLPRVWAAVAFKGRVGGKRRLSGLLSPYERTALGLAMLEDVLDALHDAPSMETILLVTPEAHLPDSLFRGRVRRVLDPAGDTVAAGDGLNPAFRMAQQLATEAGVASLLLMPGDLPTISAADIEALLDARRSGGVVLAPDRTSTGTNALLLSPPSLLAPAFGDASFVRHCRLALAAGADPVVVARPGLGLDIDLPADVAALAASNTDCRARRLLLEVGVRARLDALAGDQAGDQARRATI